MKIFAGIKSLAAWRRKVNSSAAFLLDLPEWKNVEAEIRKEIVRLYKQLGACSPGELGPIQAAITARVEFFEKLHLMAGKVWGWAGYKELDDATAIDDEDELQSELEEKIQAGALKAGQE